MVGVRRSKGCSFCVKRRVKCDEHRPQCGNCVKYGAECPGYSKEFKFVVAKYDRSRRHYKEDRSSSPSDAFVDDSPAKSESPSSSTPTSEVSMQLQSRVTTPDRLSSPDLYVAQGLSFLIDHLKVPGQTPASHVTIIHWLTFLPTRPAISNELKCALRCFMAHQLGRLSNDQQMMTYGRSAYVHALSMLQRALRNPNSWDSSDTLCSAMLLGFYELFAGSTSYDSWMKHASGIGRLIQARGPQRHRTEFDNCLLKSFRGVLIMDALFNGKNCFFAEPKWQEVARERFDDKVPDEVFNLVEDFTGYLSYCPVLVRRGYSLRDAQVSGLPPNLTEVSDLRNETYHLHQKFKAWFARFTRIMEPPTEALSTRADPLYPVIYQYADKSMGVVYLAYWACIIIMHEILAACGHPEDFTMESERLADNICKSVECLGEGPWGAYRMGFSLRIAFEVNNIERRKWIKNLLGGFSKTYAATNPESYPSVEQSYPSVEQA